MKIAGRDDAVSSAIVVAPDTAHDEVRELHLASHVEEEGLDARREARAAVAVLDELQIALSCLMRDFQPEVACCQPRRCLHHGHVDRVRALGAAKDQNPRRTIDPLRRHVEELRTNRIACDKSLPSEEADGRLERHRGAADDSREQPVRESRHRVLLEQQRGNPPRGGGEHDRPRAVPAHPDDNVG